MVHYTWSNEDAERYLAGADPLALPINHITLPPHAQAEVLSIFDARHTNGLLPERELSSLPNFEEHPQLCLFDMDGADHLEMVPSQTLRMRHTGPNKVQITRIVVLKGDASDDHVLQHQWSGEKGPGLKSTSEQEGNEKKDAGCKPGGGWYGPK